MPRRTASPADDGKHDGKPVPRVTVATVTPFAPSGCIDAPAVAKHVEWLKGHGITSIIAGGTTGEFAGLTSAERVQVLTLTRKALGPDGFIFGNASACCIDDALALAAEQASSAGKPDALLLLPPFYHAPFSSELGHAGVEAFFAAFLERYASLKLGRGVPRPPIFLYSFAMHTQQPISVEAYGRLAAKHPLLRGIKASAVSVETAKAYAAAAPRSTVMIGNGHNNLPSLRAGLSVVSGDCCGVAWALAKLLRLHEARDEEGAQAVQEALKSIWRGAVMDHHDEVPAVKAAFASCVGSCGAVRPPLVALPPKAAALVVAGMRRLRAAVDAVPEAQAGAAAKKRKRA